MDKDKLLDKFYEFEVEIPMLIEDLEFALSKSKNYKNIIFDYSLSTLDKIEGFYLDYLRGKEKSNYSRNHFDRIILAYLGEFLIHHSGGRWEMGLDNDFTYGTPMVYGSEHDSEGIGFSPVGLREKIIEEKRKGIFRQSLEYCINRKEIDKDLMRQMEELSKKSKKK